METTTSTSSDNDDSSWLNSSSIVGYDFEFDPPLESKYECPICLMCQRDCVQTSCGHKFCGPCILAWLRREREQCPQDNRPLSESDIYPDNYTRREIAQLSVKCPNAKNGCPVRVELGVVEAHLTECEYLIVACPNRCSMRTVRRELVDHCQSSCLRRKVNCSMCDAQFQLNEQNVHLTTCPMMSVTCDSCQYVLPRRELQLHLSDECPRSVVACYFTDVGCKHRAPRADLPVHLQESTQAHMKLLAHAYKNVSGFMSDVGRAVGALSSASPAASPCLDRQLTGAVSYSVPATAGPSSAPVDVQRRSGSTSSSATIDGAVCAASPSSTAAAAATCSGHLRSLSVPSDESRGAAAGSSQLEQRLQMDFSKLDLGKKSVSPEKVIKDICENNVRLEQRSREQSIQIQNLRGRVRELSETTGQLRAQLSGDMLARSCNGVFVWRLGGFAAQTREMLDNVSKVVHSPCFYTSPFGYKVCMRANLYSRDGERYLSLFLHMRRGDNDDILEWPFSGRFIVTMIDQSDNTIRHDFTEVMLTKPGLEAFERPRDDRNVKGWGFAQFLSLARIRSQYLRRDTVIVKCVVQVGNGYREEAIPTAK